VEPHELPEETAVREILEETGLSVRVVGETLPSEVDPDAFFLRQPAYMQCVTALEKGGAVYHIDVAFACLPVGQYASLPPLSGNSEVEAAKWVHLDSLDKMSLAKNVAEGVRHSLEVFRRFGAPAALAGPSYNNMQ
jgi:8-oxo-dGTP pyrophosphatase MutT (NUDIX family)